MKLVKTLLVAGLLLALAPAASAAEDATNLVIASESQAASLEALEADLFAAESGCEDGMVGEHAVGAPEAEAASTTQPCGQCSSVNCRGANRGGPCYLGSGSGWGSCNIYSGGYRCSTGGWECSCQGTGTGGGTLP